MSPARGGDRTKASIFISYSRVDTGFVDPLCEALKQRGYEPLRDLSHIRRGEGWWSRIVELIERSTVAIFVMSPNAVDSEICQREIKVASQQCGKRIIPLMFRNLGDRRTPDGLHEPNQVNGEALGRGYDAAAAVWMAKEAARQGPPDAFSELERSWVDAAEGFLRTLKEGPAFERLLAELDEAIQLDDLVWRDEQADWLRRTRAWMAEEKSPEALLPALDLARARSWAERRPEHVAIPEDIGAFIAASAEKLASDRDRLLTITGRAFVRPAEQALTERRHDAALRLSAAGVVLGEDIGMTLVPERRRIITLAAGSQALRAVLRSEPAELRCAAFSPDGRRIVAGPGDVPALWDGVTFEKITDLRGHEGMVSVALFSPDGRKVLTGSSDNSVRLWDVDDGRELQVLRGHEDHIWSATFSADAKLIATAAADKMARVWDGETGALLAVLEGHTNIVTGVSFNSDRTRLLTSSEANEEVKLWDTASWKQAAALTGHEYGVWRACFSRDGQFIMTASSDETVRIWSTSGEELKVLKHPSSVYDASLSSDGLRVVSASKGGHVRVWDIASGEQVWAKNHADVQGVSFSPDGTRIATIGGRTARVWDALSGREIVALQGHEAPLWVGAFSGDGTRLITASEDGTARVWDTGEREILRLKAETIVMRRRLRQRHARPTPGVSELTFSADGSRLATISGGSTARIWDAQSGDELLIIEDEVSEHPLFSPDGRSFITVAFDPEAIIRDTVTGDEIAVLRGHEESLWSAVFSPDGSRAVTASQDHTARLWDARTGECLALFRGHEGALISARFNADGTRVITASFDKTARIWDASPGLTDDQRLIAVLSGHEEIVIGGAFSPDGSRVLTASGDGAPRLWDTISWTTLHVLKHGRGEVEASFSPDGARVVTTSGGSARIWDVSSGRRIARMVCPLATHAVFSSDSSRLLTASGDGLARIWDVESGVELIALQHDNVKCAAFSPDGMQIATGSDDGTVRFFDISYSAALTGSTAEVLAAGLSHGRGEILPGEQRDLLMQMVAQPDLYEGVMGELTPLQRESAMRRAAALSRPLHPNCYVPVEHRLRIAREIELRREDDDDDRRYEHFLAAFPAAKRRTRWRLWILIGLMVLGAAAAAAWWWLRSRGLV